MTHESSSARKWKYVSVLYYRIYSKRLLLNRTRKRLFYHNKGKLGGAVFFSRLPIVSLSWLFSIQGKRWTELWIEVLSNLLRWSELIGIHLEITGKFLVWLVAPIIPIIPTGDFHSKYADLPLLFLTNAKQMVKLAIKAPHFAFSQRVLNIST